jgi:hypothetical protein
MSDTEGQSPPAKPPLIAGTLVGNGGEPIRLTGFQLTGFAAESVEPKPNENTPIKIWERLAITSDVPEFFRLIEGLNNYVSAKASEAGRHVLLDRANAVLIVAKPDQSAELWIDTAASAIQMRPRRPLMGGQAVFRNDIADITGVSFPMVSIEPGDQVIYLFREGWRFGLYFDLAGITDVADLTRVLGGLYRGLAYRHLYDSLNNPQLMDRLIAAGWFPFAEIVANDARDLLRACEAGFDLARVEEQLLALFTKERVEGILERWLAKPHFKAKEKLLRSAIEAFLREDSVATIKTLITEIEGIVCDGHEAVTGSRAKASVAIDWALKNAETNAGTPFSLMLPREFSRYLKESIFANFDPQTGTGQFGSRHAVGHGASPEDAYTQVRALQVILTLDQFAFYV